MFYCSFSGGYLSLHVSVRVSIIDSFSSQKLTFSFLERYIRNNNPEIDSFYYNQALEVCFGSNVCYLFRIHFVTYLDMYRARYVCRYLPT